MAQAPRPSEQDDAQDLRLPLRDTIHSFEWFDAHFAMPVFDIEGRLPRLLPQSLDCDSLGLI